MNESNIEDLARRAGFLSDLDEPADQGGGTGPDGGLRDVAGVVVAALRTMFGRIAG